MIHEAELAKAIAQTEQAHDKKSAIVTKIIRSINDAERMIAQLDQQDQNETKRTLEILKENAELKIKVAAVKKELIDQTSRANRLEAELQEQARKYQETVKSRTVVNNVYYPSVAAKYIEETDKYLTGRGKGENEERMIAMSTVLSFGSTRMTQDSVQTIVDLLYFALNDRTPKEDKAIKKLMADFRKELRSQMNVKDSTQNFYMK